MGSFADLLIGSMWLAGGILLLVYWKMLVQGAIDSDRAVSGFLGIPVRAERFKWIMGRIIVTLVGAGFIVAGIEDFYKFFTGREFPLRYMQWKDLWPF